MFYGRDTPKIDEKGRFFLPAKHRSQLTDGLFIAPFYDHCLAVYPVATFEALAQRAAAMPASVSRVRDYQREMAGEADEQVPDKQGRVRIPSWLREYADLGDEVLVRGVLDRVELWNPKVYADRHAARGEIIANLDDEIWPERPRGDGIDSSR
jgi:MraZ protein